MGGLSVDIGRHDIGLDLVSLHVGVRARVTDRVQDGEELVRRVALAERGPGDHGPDGRMSVLASVLADARRIPFDVAGIEGRAGERRREEKDQPLVTLDEMRLHGGHGSRRVGRLGRARDHPPRLGDRIDPALRVHDGSERRPVVEVGAAVPPSVPAMLLEGSLEGPHVLAPHGGAPLVAAILGHRREALEGRMEKPPEPDALAAPGRADPVHPVVPVARADQGEAVRADG